MTAPWGVEGPDGKGIDIGVGLSAVGRNNAYVWSGGRRWNALFQDIPVWPRTNYVLTAMVRTSSRVNTGFSVFRADPKGYFQGSGKVVG